LLGTVVTGATVLVQTRFDVAVFFNVFTVVGVALLFALTASPTPRRTATTVLTPTPSNAPLPRAAMGT
jgi:hypothetical protein